MPLSADVPPFVSGQVFHGSSPNQYPLQHNVNTGSYIAAGPQVGPTPSVPNNSNQTGYQHYMLNCYQYVTDSIPQDGRQQPGYGSTQAAGAPYSVPQANHPYSANPYDGYHQQEQMYQPVTEPHGIGFQDPYYAASYYPGMPSNGIQQQQHQQMTSMQSYQSPLQQHGPPYNSVPNGALQYQVPYNQLHSYETAGHLPQQHHSQGRHKHYSGNKHRGQRYNAEQSNVGCEAVSAELEAIKKKKTVVYTDAECQTDFPEHIANKTLCERPIEELIPVARAVTKSTGNQTGEDGRDSSSESGCDEESRPQDSDSGYSGAGMYPPIPKRDLSRERGDWTERPGADSGLKSYANVASQRYPQHPPHLPSYQQQWPLPPSAMMNAQAQCTPMKLPGNSFAGIVSGSHQHPPQQQQMVPHGFAMGIPRPPVAYPAQVPPMHAQPVQPMGSEPGIVRIRQDSKKTRKGRKQGHHLPHPPPMINDSNEYPELPAAGPGTPYGAGFAGFPQASPFSNILQQRLNPSNEVDSDTSSDKDGPNSEELKGSKVSRKKSKKSTQEYQDILGDQSRMQDIPKKSGKRSQRPMELDLSGLVINNRSNVQTSQPHFGQGRPVMYGSGIPYGSQPPPMAYQQSMHPQNHQWQAGHMRSGQVNKGPVHKKVIGSNPLDSSAPVMKGKMKENQAKKKPSAMKKVIIAERLEKRRLKDLQEKQLSDNEDGLTQSTTEFDSNCYDSSFALSQDAPSDRNSLSMNTSHSDLSPLSQQDPLSLSPPSPATGFAMSSASGGSSQSEVLALKRIHSNKWREYCKQILTKEIDACCTTLLQMLVKFQERQYNRDGPVKAKSKRRIVMGLREVSKHLEKKKNVTCIIVSTNMEKIQSKGGIDEVLSKITSTAQEQGVPVVFALCRSALGRAVNKIVPVSVVGILNHNGAEEAFNQLTELVDAAREEYRNLLQEQKRDIEMKKSKNIGKHLGHRRNISNCSGISFNSFISEPISENDPEPEPDLDLDQGDIAVEYDDSVRKDDDSVRKDDDQKEAKKHENVDATSSLRDGSTEKTNSEASVCTVEEQHRKQLGTTSSQDQSCKNIEEEDEEAAHDGNHDNDEGEEDKDDEEVDSDEPLAPEVSATERVNSWVAETQQQVGILSIEDINDKS